jgi:hypothetical protein
MCRDIRSYEKCSPERGKQIGGFLHLPILKKQLYMFRLPLKMSFRRKPESRNS